jgi:hypothetical protein
VAVLNPLKWLISGRARPAKSFALMIGNTAFALMIALMIRAIGALDGCYDGRTASIITL